MASADPLLAALLSAADDLALSGVISPGPSLAGSPESGGVLSLVMSGAWLVLMPQSSRPNCFVLRKLIVRILLSVSTLWNQ